MRVAVLGGTGRMGRALAKQLSRNNQVIIGSRDAARARSAAAGIRGAVAMDYVDASKEADVVVFAIPYAAIRTASSVANELSGKVVISLINPLKIEKGVLTLPLKEGSAAQELAKLLPDSEVATAFNAVPALFFEKEDVVPMDILVAADTKQTYDRVAELVRTIPNLRPLYAGPLFQAHTVEEITPLVLNLAKLNGTGSLSMRFVSAKDPR